MKRLDEQAVIDGFAAGKSLRDLAAEHGVSTTPIQRVLAQNGVDPRPIGRRGKDKAPRRARSTARSPDDFSVRERGEVKRRFLAGEKQVALADAYNCAPATIARVLRAAGVPAGAHGQLREHHHAWRGGRRVNDEGYVMVRIEDGDELARAMCPSSAYVLEHRLVMARRLGRPLLSEETVHHGPGGRLDNRLENLELWTSRHPRGQRVEDLLAFAREIVGLYG